MPSESGSDSGGHIGRQPIRAAQYVRMSTEHQQYSTENQADAIRQYANRRGLEIVRTYADEGRSGLRIDGRDALKQLIDDVVHHRADFSAILVYDVSRWGRFQDADESAYYEYICRREGIAVHYCAEQFENDGSPVATIVKGVKRAMAGEYSRELSAKVFAGQCRLIERGFRQGGTAGYGLRRRLIDQSGVPKGELAVGEHKSIQTDRVILVPGPLDEIKVVRWIYRTFVEDRKGEAEIAALLNERRLMTDLGRPWTRGTVHQVLINDKYTGDNVWNRQSFKLKKKRVRNDPEMWIRARDVFQPLVSRALFDAAQAIIRQRSQRLTDDQMLDQLRQLLQDRGYLSGLIIDEAERLPSSSSYQNRFGSLLRAYALVGFTPDRDYRYIEINQSLRKMHPDVVSAAVSEIERVGGSVERDTLTDLLVVNREFTVSIVIARCRRTTAGSLRWHIRFDTVLHPDITVAIRMDPENRSVADYYLLPWLDMSVSGLRLSEDNGMSLDAYRYETLDALYALAARVSLLEVA
ncbi:MAG: recombinase family protein [Parvibaculaceae bacterium]